MNGENLPVAMPLAQSGSNAALVTFLLYMVAVFALAGLSGRLLQRKSFLSEYFLGSRGLGVWAFALTFAATSSSGGSFTGFPSKIYTHGWVLALWIGSYMVVPICTMGLLGKRLNHVSRLSGAITIPDVLRDRFASRYIGLLAVSLIVFFMSFNLVAQFKAGSLILKTLLADTEVFHTVSSALFGWLTSGEGGFFSGLDPGYLLCLFTFGVAVIVYTTYGGFRAVVWTDVMQGVVMVIGVLIMLLLALYQVGKYAPPQTGSLEFTTRQMARMTPPRIGTATLTSVAASDEVRLRTGQWLTIQVAGSARPRLFRLTESARIPAGGTATVGVLEITTPEEIDRQVAQLAPTAVASEVEVRDASTQPYAYGSRPEQRGAYVTAPGPDPVSENGFLPISLAVSFFCMWAISGAGQPSTMVRLMAFKNTRTLRLSIVMVAIYYSAIYLPLVIIFCCARILLPGMEAESDRVMPAMAVHLSQQAGIAWLAGLLVAAPFAAVMSTVDSFLLVISSALVRDVYQRNINPDADEKVVKRLCYLCTLIVGTAAMIGAINPPQFLQDIIVYVGSGLAACFVGPAVYTLYWHRANAVGGMAGMLGGFVAHLSLYLAGIFANGSFFTPYRIFNFDPIIFGLLMSFATGYVVTLLTPPPPQALVEKYFYRQRVGLSLRD